MRITRPHGWAPGLALLVVLLWAETALAHAQQGQAADKRELVRGNVPTHHSIDKQRDIGHRNNQRCADQHADQARHRNGEQRVEVRKKL